MPLRTTVIGSYPLPGWLEFACAHLDQFGESDRAELQDDAVIAAIHDQMAAGLDIITDGEQTRLDFNLSFYGYLEGIELETTPFRRFGPPAHDQRPKHKVIGGLAAPRGLGVVEEFKRLKRLAACSRRREEAESGNTTSSPPSNPPPHVGGYKGPVLKASVPGPYTLSGCLYSTNPKVDRFGLTEPLIPIVRKELQDLVAEGCTEITVDEPSMSCYAYRENPARFVDIFNRTVAPVVGKCRLSTHLCFGNYKARGVGPRSYKPMFPAFLDFNVNEIHVEMASREFAELEIIREIAAHRDVAVGIVDVKSYYIETPDDIADRVRRCLKLAPPEKLSFAPDCGLSQTARWAAKQKLKNLVEGVQKVRRELGLAVQG